MTKLNKKLSKKYLRPDMVGFITINLLNFKNLYTIINFYTILTNTQFIDT